jgi:hypothetical protein
VALERKNQFLLSRRLYYVLGGGSDEPLFPYDGSGAKLLKGYLALARSS